MKNRIKVPQPAPVKRPDPDPIRLDEVMRHLRVKIRHADKHIHDLRDEADFFKEEDRTIELAEKMIEIANWLARRRALVEVWEFASNEVWIGSRGV